MPTRTKENFRIMVKLFFVCILCFAFHFNVKSQIIDSTAHKEIESGLSIIKSFLTDKNSSLGTNRNKLIKFFTNLTGIVSESDADYFGQSTPTNNDYINWSKWYILNKDFISWDNKKKQIVINKRVTLYELK